MAKATVSDRSDFFKDGLYDLETKSFEFRDGHKGLSFIAKFVVKSSTNSEIQPGMTRSWIVKLDGSKDQKSMAMGDIKGLFFALAGTTTKDVGPPEKNPSAHEQATKAFKCSINETYAKANGFDPNFLVGRPVKLECTLTKTKPSEKKPQGGEFTRHAWSPA